MSASRTVSDRARGVGIASRIVGYLLLSVVSLLALRGLFIYVIAVSGMLGLASGFGAHLIAVLVVICIGVALAYAATKEREAKREP